MTSFENVISSLKDYKQQRPKITQEQYEEFQRHWLVYALEEKRYGQAFCDHFGIQPITPLYWYKDNKISEQWILDNYIV